MGFPAESLVTPLFALAAALVALFLVGRLLTRLTPRPFNLLASALFALLCAALLFWPSGESIYRSGVQGGEAFIAAIAGSVAGAIAGFISLWRAIRNRPAPSESAAAPRPAAQGPAAQASPSSARTSAPDVFISYKRDERAVVAEIAQRLSALRLSVWFDADMRSGTTFDAEIDRQVRAAKCVLVCWSPGAVVSDWVRGEATIGRQRGVLCAAMLHPCDLPAPFNLVHTNDLTNGIDAAGAEWLAVLQSIGALVGRPGLAAYQALASSRDPALYGSWVARYPNDPLLDDVMRQLKAISA